MPTYITWDNHRSDNVEYAITVYDHKGNSYALWYAAQKAAFSKLAGKAFPADSVAMIDVVTTDNSLSHLISKVTISAPAREFYEKIRLIDAPGVNPGMEGTAEHVRFTQEALRDAADAAIIMFPFDQVYTASFEKFLTENALHLLKNSKFVITKCDYAKSDDDLKELCDFVTLHLKKIGVKAPVIHCISANSALNAYYDSEKATETDKMWKERFEKTIQTIFSNMSATRSSIVRKNAYDLANQISTHAGSMTVKKCMRGERREIPVSSLWKRAAEALWSIPAITARAAAA